MILVNGRQIEWNDPKISYGQILGILGLRPELLVTIIYHRGPSSNVAGSMAPASSVDVKNGMVFDIAGMTG